MLADQVDYVIGVDTHRDRHAAALLSTAGAVLHEITISASTAGYAALLREMRQRAAPRRAWAVEGTGSYGAGLSAFLVAAGERVLEIDRPTRRRPRSHAKSDALDAVRAAREAIAREQHALPRARGNREALRALVTTREGAVLARTAAINQLRALIVVAPDSLRADLRTLPFAALIHRCAHLRPAARDNTTSAIALALRTCAQRIQHLSDEANTLKRHITQILHQHAPALLHEPGIGPISAARLAIAWSHPGRVRSEAAFSMLAGASPIPASSGQTIRYRLNRGGDRQLNRALHTIVLIRATTDPPTRRYLDRRIAEGKTRREAVRCLKRYIARRTYRLLLAANTP